MALKDLVSDLSSFGGDDLVKDKPEPKKHVRPNRQPSPKFRAKVPSLYDKLDTQIEKGVDFFSNDDASGFTPKTNLESLYKKVNSAVGATDFIPSSTGTFGPEGGDVAPYANLKPLESRRSAFKPLSNGSIGLAVDGAHPPALSEYSTIAEFKANQIYRPFDQTMTTLLDIDGYSITSQPAGISRVNPRGIEFTPQLTDFPTYTFNKKRNHEPEPYHWSRDKIAPVEPPGIFSPKNYKVSFGRGVNNENLRGRYKDGSVHEKSEDSLVAKAGGGAVIPVGFSSLTPIADRTSQFQGTNSTTYGVPDSFDTTQTTLNIPAIETTGPFEGSKNIGPFKSTHRSVDAANVSQFDITTFHLRSEDNLGKIDEIISFNKGIYPFGQFDKVPIGQDPTMNGITMGNYRDISDPFQVDYAREPYILRPIPSGNDGKDEGNFTYPGRGRWGTDVASKVPGDGLDFIFSGGNTMFRGAPTISGLIERTVVDKLRIGKFLTSPKGISFLAKQVALQALNPTYETKFYNPGSLLGISTDVTDPLEMLKINTIGIGLPIVHVARHLGGLTYEDVIKKDAINTEGSRLVWQSKAMTLILGGTDLGSLKSPTRGKVKWLDKAVDKQVNKVETGVSAATAAIPLALSNPNKYISVLSSAPLSVGKDGISFVGGPLEAFSDANKAISGRGKTFNKDTNKVRIPKNHTVPTLKSTVKHASLLYGQLINHSDKGKNRSYGTTKVSPTEWNMHVNSGNDVWASDSPMIEKRKEEAKVLLQTGHVGATELNYTHDKELGTIKKQDSKFRTDSTDKVNMIPYGRNYQYQGEQGKDFIKFKFHDMVNDKYLIFRAILEGISDSITPEYGEERYVGRPDKVYSYQGADRNVSFTFSIYPKTKQELPILMEKLNYLVGLCYPSYTTTERMITPFMRLTLGDMFNEAPGLLWSLNISVEDTGTWELDEGLQFPHYIKAQCEFKYIGNNVLASKGKHYGLNWIPDGSSRAVPGVENDKGKIIEAGMNRFTNPNDLGFDHRPTRKRFKELFDDIVDPPAPVNTPETA